MTSNAIRDAAAVEQAVSRIADLRPAYAAILGFYGPVFVAQMQALENTSPDPIRIDESDLAMRADSGFALIEPVAFSVDMPAAEKLLAEICAIAASSGEKLGGAGEALGRAMDDGLAMNGLLADVLDDRGRIEALAERLQVPADMLSLLLYLSVKPSIQVGSRQLAALLNDDRENSSHCAVCGSAPIIGELDGDGRLWLHCGLCWHRWAVKRSACPFCENRDCTALEYLYSDDEPEYRVNLCDGCRRYLKVVDTRKLARGFFPPLEQVVSLHLDMMAAEKGFKHAAGPSVA